MSKVTIFFICTLFLIFFVFDVLSNDMNTNEQESASLVPCKACKVYVEAFERGMEKTANGQFAGGNSAWEASKLGSYSDSEIRLTEIEEMVCSDEEKYKDRCYALHEQYESSIEKWWFNMKKEEPNLFQYLCIDTEMVCCPNFHFGAECLPCPGYPDNICNTNGKCRGAGTRSGNGSCVCDIGYAGEFCDSCRQGYFELYNDGTKLVCSKCHDSCAGSCRKGGPIGCEKCAKGWIMQEENGCTDINECAKDKTICSPSKFCVNTEGSYRCLDCDPSCVGCTGDGPDMCIACADGYTLMNNVCIDSEKESRRLHMLLTRYLTYFGLCLATCIIFQRNVLLAAVIGIAVSIYISLSEYILQTPREVIPDFDANLPVNY